MVTIGVVAERVEGRDWTFLTNHAHVLLCLAADPDVLLRDVATKVGITERAAQLIVADLESAGYITRTRVGRRNHYAIKSRRRLRHPLESHRTIEVLLDIVQSPRGGRRPSEAKPARGGREDAGSGGEDAGSGREDAGSGRDTGTDPVVGPTSTSRQPTLPS